MRNPPKKPRRLALALHAALLALPTVGSLSLLPQAAQAQSAPATYRFDIPAGPLSTALTRIAAQAGVQLTANAELTAGKNAPAIKGGMSLSQALERQRRRLPRPNNAWGKFRSPPGLWAIHWARRMATWPPTAASPPRPANPCWKPPNRCRW